MTGVFQSKEHLHRTRQLLESRVLTLENEAKLSLETLDEFVLSPTFYYIYQGLNDKQLLTRLHSAYARAYPSISRVEIDSYASSPPAGDDNDDDDAQDKKGGTASGAIGVQAASATASDHDESLRVAFVSSYFRRHSICKLFCGVMTALASPVHGSSALTGGRIEVYAFSSLAENKADAKTAALLKLSRSNSHHFHFISIGKTFMQNREEVTRRKIDILIYLDVGMDPSTSIWAAARLAPIQVHTHIYTFIRNA